MNTRVTMVPFGVVASIGQDTLWTRYLQRGFQERHETVNVRARAAADENAQQQMAATIERCLEFGVAAVSDAMQAWFSGVSTPHVVVAASTAIQARGVQSDAWKTSAVLKETAHSGVEQAPGSRDSEQPPTCLLERGEVRNALQVQKTAQGVEVAQDRGDAAIVGFEERLQNQTDKELMLGVGFGTESMRIERQFLPRQAHRLPPERHRRFCECVLRFAQCVHSPD